MRTTRIIRWIGGAAILLVAGSGARAQQPDRLPPYDQSGVAIPSLGILQMPGDPGPDWILDDRPQPTGYEFVTVGRFQAATPGELRLDTERGEEVVVTVLPDTTWFLEGRPVTPDEIPAGSTVRAVFDLEGNERVARRVEAAPPGEPGIWLADPTAPPVLSEMPGAKIEVLPPSAVAREDGRPAPGGPSD